MTNKSLPVLLILSLFLFGITNAQDFGKIEQLKNDLLKVEDSLKTEIYRDLCWELRNSDIQESINYGLKAVEFAQRFEDIDNLTKSYSFLGVAYRNIGNYSKAFDYYYKGLELAQEYQISSQEGFAYINIGNLYLYQGYYNEALKHLESAKIIAEKESNDKILGYYYINKGRIEIKIKKIQEALISLNKAAEIRKDTKNPEELAVCYKYIGDAYTEQNDFDQALFYYKKAIQKLESTTDIDLMANNYNKIASLYFNEKAYEEALKYAKQSLALAKKIGSKLRIRNANQSLLLIYKEKGNFKKAFEHQTTVLTYNDSLFNQELDEKIRHIQFLGERYEYEKQLNDMEYDHQLEIQKEHQIRNYAIFSAVVFVILSFILMLFFRTKRKANIKLLSKNEQIAEQSNELERSLDEIKNANEQLSELNATKDKFLTILAHDLKTPFNTIISFSDLLLRNYNSYDRDKIKEFLGYINKSGENTYKLLENLLLWTRSQIGVIEYNPKKENLYDISLDTVELVNQIAGSKSITLKNDIPKDMFVEADKELYVTIIRNLLTNAVKFTPKGKSISIKAAMPETAGKKGYTEISVIDEGIGISEEKQEKLFSVTESISTKGTEDEDGSGLGLILCKEFVEMHGGKMRIESQVNAGTTISFTIPTAK